MTKFERFTELIMELFVVQLVIALVLCIANFAILVFSHTEIMWLIRLTTAYFTFFAAWAVVFLSCFVIDKIKEYKAGKSCDAEREDE